MAIQPVASAKAFNEKKSDALEPDWFIAAGAYPGFFSMKRLGVFLLLLDGMRSPSQGVSPQFVRFSQH